MRQKIIVLRGSARTPPRTPGQQIVPFEELRQRILRGEVLKLLLAYQEARLWTNRLDMLSRPLLSALFVRLLSRRAAWIEDDQGVNRRVTTALLAGAFAHLIRDLLGRPALFARIRRELDALERCGTCLGSMGFAALPPVYLRTDLIFGLRAGGSVGHIAGVLNNLEAFTAPPVFFTTDAIPTVDPGIETHIVLPSGRFLDFNQLPLLHFNHDFLRGAEACLQGRAIGFVYQRYSLNNYAGLALARRKGVPFVLEYNGSELWVSRNWGSPLKYEALADRIERLNLRSADLVVVISKPLRNELEVRGIDPGKILVNPNGVDPERYSPAVDGTAIRAKYHFEQKTVIGFIGTFGRWHGAEVLVEAFGRLLEQRPDLRGYVRLLMIGDGNTMPLVRACVERLGGGDVCVLTGSVAQQEGPAHLAACDILAAPHVPNADGTPFFGSPTKLFEYMAMGKGIVASDLDQIGEVLHHDETAWLVRPGDVASLAEGLLVLIGDGPLRERLGRAARDEVVARYTWAEHTRRIVEKLKELCTARRV